jgi:hypothetical protein
MRITTKFCAVISVLLMLVTGLLAAPSDLARIRQLIFDIPSLPPVVDRDNAQQLAPVMED